MNIRKACSADITELQEIWSGIFGDSYRFLDSFFSLLFPVSTAFVADDDGQLIGSAYIIEISTLKNKDVSIPCPYIYAVGVLPEFRGKGIGKQLILACRDYCREKGWASCLVPADSGLFDYYERSAAYVPGFTVSEYELEQEGAVKAEISAIDAEKYGELREKLLTDTAHLEFNSVGLKFWKSICEIQDGGFYKLSAENSYAIAACEFGDEGFFIKELLCSDDNARGFAAALLWHFDYDTGYYRTPANAKHPESTRTFGMLDSVVSGGPHYFGPAFD